MTAAASILVVDDLPAMREMINRSLASEGYRVATAESGEEAVTRIAEQEFDVIVTDLVMPGGVDGLEVLERARLLGVRAAIILITAHASLETAVADLRGGACDYLEKPFPLADLTVRVQRLLQHREAIWRDPLVRRALHPRAETHTLIGE